MQHTRLNPAKHIYQGHSLPLLTLGSRHLRLCRRKRSRSPRHPKISFETEAAAATCTLLAAVSPPPPPSRSPDAPLLLLLLVPGEGCSPCSTLPFVGAAALGLPLRGETAGAAGLVSSSIPASPAWRSGVAADCATQHRCLLSPTQTPASAPTPLSSHPSRSGKTCLRKDSLPTLRTRTPQTLESIRRLAHSEDRTLKNKDTNTEKKQDQRGGIPGCWSKQNIIAWTNTSKYVNTCNAKQSAAISGSADTQATPATPPPPTALLLQHSLFSATAGVPHPSNVASTEGSSTSAARLGPSLAAQRSNTDTQAAACVAASNAFVPGVSACTGASASSGTVGGRGSTAVASSFGGWLSALSVIGGGAAGVDSPVEAVEASSLSGGCLLSPPRRVLMLPLSRRNRAPLMSAVVAAARPFPTSVSLPVVLLLFLRMLSASLGLGENASRRATR